MKLNTDALIDHPKLLLRSFPRVSKVIGRQKSAVFAAFRLLYAGKETQRCGGTLFNPDWQQHFVYSCSVRFCF
jgi:hypothetical protein